ncbi:MAG: hypothetical protein M3463_06950 [Verrucomicrobiota bacterium]|nr:hypothetical protein [Verrucomicrobiota bacterium]
MRAGPLSNPKVISLLNRYFVPVYTVNEEYRSEGSASPEEKAERNRIFKEGHAAKLSVGSVHVYILGPDGHLIDTMHVARAAKTQNLIALLEKTAADLDVPEGKPVVAPVTQSQKPLCEPGGVALHLTARSLDGKGAWGDFPVENWIVLSSGESKSFLPARDAVSAGDSWEIPRELATKLLTHFYPATENNNVAKNVFEKQSLKATVISLDKGVARARLTGEMRMAHSFYHKDDGKMVEATVIGFIDFEPVTQQIHSLQLVTDQATYGGGKFAVALRSVH